MASSAYHAELTASCPTGWRVASLTSVALFQEGPGILAKDFLSDGIPLIRLKGMEGDFVTLDGCNYLDPVKVKGKWNHFRLNRGDLVISTSASFGRVSEVTEESEGAIPYTGLIRFRPSSDELDTSYLRAFLGSAAFMQQVEAMASGSVIRHFGPMHLKQMALHLPPLPEQRAIGQLSNMIADRLRLLRQTNATLEAIAQALFKSWFVDFGPVHAKAEGREPEGMDAATAALFPNEFEDSELGPIPKGWTVAPFTTQFEFTMGQSPPGSTYNNDRVGVPFFQGCTDFGDVFPDERIYCSQPTRFAKAGDLLMSVRAPVGALNIASVDCSIGRGLCAIRHKSGSTGLSYQYVKACMDRIENAAGEGALFNSLSKHQLATLPVLAATDDLIGALASILNPLTERMIANAKQAADLASLRDTLLPRLISGKLRLPEAEALADRATAVCEGA